MSLTLDNGSKLNLSIPPDAGASIATVGANGTTELLAQSLKQMAQQLVEQGDISQDDANAVNNLANYAYQMAALEKFIADKTASANGDVSLLANTPVTYNGATYPSLQELSRQLGATPEGNYGPMMAQLWDYFGEVSNMPGFYSSPELLGTVNALTAEIHHLGNANSWALDDMVAYPSPEKKLNAQLSSYMTNNGYDNTAAKLQSSTGAQVTATDAADICTTGGQSANGASCN